MAFLSIVGSFSVNGVAKIHSEILIKDTFKNFYEIYPNMFNNKTNGITQRRWLLYSNSELTKLIEKYTKTNLLKDFDSISELNKYLDNNEYYKLRDILQNVQINYIESNLLDLKINDTYDLIYLSNILEYVKKSAYFDKIDELSVKNKGIIISYIFGEIDKAIKMFNGDFDYREFDGGSGVIINHGKHINK